MYLPYRQEYSERRSGAKLACQVDGAVMHLDDLFGDGEAKAAAFLRALPRLVRFIEALKDVDLIFFLHAYSCVCDGEHYVAFLSAQRDAHAAAVGSEFDAVVEHIEPHLTQEIFVGGDGNLFQRHVHIKRFTS